MFKSTALTRLATLGLLASAVGCGGHDTSDVASGAGGPNSGKGFGGSTSGNAGQGSSNRAGASGVGGASSGSNGAAQPKGFDGVPGTTGFKPLTPGCGPSTAHTCTNSCETQGGSTSTVIRPVATLCFGAAEDPTPADPIAIIEQVVEEINGKRMVHLRVTFDPHFVDNTYGVNAVGWDHGLGTGGATGSGGASGSGGAATGKGMMMPGMMMPGMGKSGHTFSDLVGSDHVELMLTDAASNTVMDFDLDYITASSSSSCGYSNLGVSGGEGKMVKGSASAILGATSSLDRNLNGCGSGDCLITDSPATDANFTPNPDHPNWDFRVVYEVWVDADAFGSSGFGQAYITFVHASPSKLANNTVTVTPGSCPPTWDTPYCPPGQSGPNCTTTGTCQPNYQLYLETEGQSVCTPIPFAGYPNMAPCPDGYELDTASEGRYCLQKK